MVLGDGQDGRNSFNGRGSNTGSVGGVFSNGRRPSSGNGVSKSINIGEGYIQTLDGSPGPGRDVLVMEDNYTIETPFEGDKRI